MSQDSNNMHKTMSTQSFDIFGETSKTNECSYDVLPNDEYNDFDEEPQILDEEFDDKLKVPYNSPLKEELQIESFSSKREQIKYKLSLLSSQKEHGQSAKTRRDIRALERHLEKLGECEKNGTDFSKFKSMMVENAKNDKNMNLYLKQIYI